MDRRTQWCISPAPGEVALGLCADDPGTRGGIAVSRRDRITKELLVEPGTKANIAGRDPAWTGGPEFEELSERELSGTAKALLADGVKELAKAQALPERGRIGIFNRSHYEEVVALRVHPEWLQKQKLPPGPRGPSFWAGRHEDINAFERHLDRSGTKVVKFFLHLSKAEQKKRFLARLDEPGKQWKFSAADLPERAHWDDYQRVFE